jgi:hypothetical protein
MSKCRDPEDRLLAFYGLVSAKTVSNVVFDYKSHWAEFFRQLAFYVAQCGDENTVL